MVPPGTMKPIYAMLISGALSVSCATTDDPRQGGLIGGMQGIGSGAYEERLRERRESLQRLEQMKQELGTEKNELEMDKAQQQARLQGLQERLARLDDGTERLIVAVKNKRAALTEDTGRQSRLERELAGLRKSIASLEQKTGSDHPVALLEAERDRLEDEYRLLLDLYLELGQ